MSDNENYLPNGWEQTTLGYVFKWGSGGTPLSGQSDYYDGKIPWAIIGDLNDTYITSTASYISEKGLKKSSAKWVEPGSVLVAMYGSIGKLGITTFPMTTNQAIAFTNPKPISAKYLFYYLLFRRDDLYKAGKGGTQRNISQTVLKLFPFVIAPLAEQIRISDSLDEIFSDLNAGIEALERVRKKIKLYRASILKAAMNGTLTKDMCGFQIQSEPASELLKRILTERRRRWEEAQLSKFKADGKKLPTGWRNKYKEPVLPEIDGLTEIPTNWCWASFDQIGETQGGLQKSPNRKPTKSHFPYLRVANVNRNKLDLTELYHFELTEEELDRLRLQPGDLLIVEGNGSRTEIGRCAIWLGEVEDCVHQNHIIRVRPITGVLPKYVNLFLNSPVGQNAIQHVASSTSGLYTLNLSKIEKLPLALPPIDEQEFIIEAIEEQLSIIEHLETDIDDKLKYAHALRLSILNHAFTGHLVPQDPNDEPASELLKRIAMDHKVLAQESTSKKRERPNNKTIKLPSVINKKIRTYK